MVTAFVFYEKGVNRVADLPRGEEHAYLGLLSGVYEGNVPGVTVDTRRCTASV